MQEFILELSSCCFLELFCDCAGQTYFSHSYFVQHVSCQRYLAVEDAASVQLSRRKIFVSVRLRGACVMKQKKTHRFNESLVVI